MSIIQPLNLGPQAFTLYIRNETRDTDWRMYHAHQGLELLFIHEGEGLVTVERQQFRIKPGMLFCFQPYQLHKVEVPGNSGAYYIRSNLTFDPRIVERYVAPFPNLRAYLRHLWRGNLAQQAFDLDHESSWLSDLLASYQLAVAHANQSQLEEEQSLFILALLRQLKLQVDLGREATDSYAVKASRHIEPIHDWIEANFHRPFSLDDMSRQLHLSRFHLSHLLKRSTGTTLSELVAARRIREACSLLAGTNKTIGDIAHAVGGFNASYFCQMFKKYKEVTPQTFRDAVRQSFE